VAHSTHVEYVSSAEMLRSFFVILCNPGQPRVAATTWPCTYVFGMYYVSVSRVFSVLQQKVRFHLSLWPNRYVEVTVDNIFSVSTQTSIKSILRLVWLASQTIRTVSYYCLNRLM